MSTHFPVAALWTDETYTNVNPSVSSNNSEDWVTNLMMVTSKLTCEVKDTTNKINNVNSTTLLANCEAYMLASGTVTDFTCARCANGKTGKLTGDKYLTCTLDVTNCSTSLVHNIPVRWSRLVSCG